MTLTVAELRQRSVEIFRELVDAYVETGEPVGSRTLSRRLNAPLSPATIRNVMADLEEAGLIYAPHTSAGRLPTEAGMRYFVHGVLEIGEVDTNDRTLLESRCKAVGKNLDAVLAEATTTLSGLSSCAGIVLAPKTESMLRHFEFVPLSPGRAIVVLVNDEGTVENRLIDIPTDLPSSVLTEASRFLQPLLVNKSLSEARKLIHDELNQARADLNELTSKVVEAGIAVWTGDDKEKTGSLIIRGQSHLLQNVTALEDLDRIRELFQALDSKEVAYKLLDASIQGDGVQIFIGSDNRLFDLAGCSVVVAPYKGVREQVLGAIGVIGPTRMNYSRIIPMVDYTAKMITRLLG